MYAEMLNELQHTIDYIFKIKDIHINKTGNPEENYRIENRL